jgi:hypothetical protein
MDNKHVRISSEISRNREEGRVKRGYLWCFKNNQTTSAHRCPGDLSGFFYPGKRTRGKTELKTNQQLINTTTSKKNDSFKNSRCEISNDLSPPSLVRLPS